MSTFFDRRVQLVWLILDHILEISTNVLTRIQCLQVIITILDSSAKGILAEHEYQVASICVGLEVFVHGSLSFESLSSNYPVLEIVTEKESKVFYIN